MAIIPRPVTVIGGAEIISFPELSQGRVHARIDTGAHTSSVWMSSISVEDDKLCAVLFAPGHPAYTGKKVYFAEFSETIVASSNGQTERRYKVKLLVDIAGRKIRARFTLADRSSQAYSVLIGRNVLRGKFIVDVKKGEGATEAEKARSEELQAKLRERN